MDILRSQLFDALQFQEEDEVPDDETLNQMIARNEDEFELYMVLKKKSDIACLSIKQWKLKLCNLYLSINQSSWLHHLWFKVSNSKRWSDN